jgi:hypothetical protein
MPRNRVITIRVSDEEYETLRIATLSRGYGNLSELARAAIQSISSDQAAPHEVLARRVNEHSVRIAALSRDMDRLLSISTNKKLSE